MRAITLDDLRRYAVARSLFKPTTLGRAIDKLGFVQADPIRAPARAQDLTLRHRVAGYTAGDLERRYPKLAVEEDYLVNYGFVPRTTLALLHPRVARRTWDADTKRKAAALLAFIRERGPSHPKDVQAAFDHGRMRNYWGGSSNASTHLLDGMHYRGLLRVARREAGIRIYETADHVDHGQPPAQRARALLSMVLHKYAPLPSRSLGHLASLLGGGAPQLRPQMRAALVEARRELPQVCIDGVTWYWPDGDNPASARHAVDEQVRLLAPFDPVVWDRLRFELLWGWTYRFEAYTPAPKRKLGYYALPLLWHEQVIGWATVSAANGVLAPQLGFVSGSRPRERAFARELDDELARLRGFLAL